jgi:hypothetical protein
MLVSAALALVLGAGGSASAQPVGDRGRIQSVEVIGTAFRVTFTTGETLEGMQLNGATISVAMLAGQRPLRVRLRRIIPDPMQPTGDVLLYDMQVIDRSTGGERPLCEDAVDGGHWAFPLRGRWDRNGRHLSDDGFTLTCAADAQGKCVRFGYKPWATGPGGISLTAYHQACIRMVRADYCGNVGTTRNGMLIDYYDRLGIQHASQSAGSMGLRFEAAWDTEGALCVAHTRVPEHVTLTQLTQTCPRLHARLGPAVCTENTVDSGRFGPALLYNSSR